MEAQALLHLLQFASPALPIGAYSYSQGLEAALEARIVRDEASARRWIVDALHPNRAQYQVLVEWVAAAADSRFDHEPEVPT